jgi:phospholipid/cholesterol/gamma-HCH transport system substrate-binding protein
MRRNQKRGLGHTTVALIAIAIIVTGTYLAFTKSIPFRSHYEVDAVVPTANQLKPGSFVRIAGVNVGTVRRVEPLGGGEQAARVTMRIDDGARPIRKDATLKIRPRILFEGNFFVDLSPGTPAAPELGAGETIPINQTSGPVQFDQVLGAFESDTRQDLKRVLSELHAAFSQGGAQAINRTMPYWEPAYRDSAIVNDAMHGRRAGDLTRYVRSAARVAEGLDRNPAQLQALIGDLRATARAFAVRDTQLEQALGELPRTLRAGQPALGAVNDALPSVRRFARDLRPGVRSSGPALDAQVPFVRQLRGLVSRAEGRGLAADLRPTVPALARLNRETVPLLEQVRAASSCQNEVVLPWTKDKIEDPDFPAIGPVYEEQTKPLVGLAGESRTFDANGQWFRVAINAGQYATPFGAGRFLMTDRPILGVNPPPPAKRSPLRPDVPCETQEPPDLRTEQARPPAQSFRVRQPPAEAEAAALGKAVEWLKDAYEQQGRTDVKVVDDLLTREDLPKLKLPGTPQLPQAPAAPATGGAGR